MSTATPTTLTAAMRRRSYLFVPANRVEWVPKAAASNCDAVILDLEDSVPDSQAEAARQLLAEGVRTSKDVRPVPVFVRVNSGPPLRDDLEAAVAAGADGIVVPKVASGPHVAAVEQLLGTLERDAGSPQGRTETLLLVESARGVMSLAEIAAAGNRTTALALGVEDLATDLEVDPHEEGFDLAWAHGLLLGHARANGIAPVGLLGSLTEIRDLDSFAGMARRSHAFGYVGALCIHPIQVPPLHEAFSPSAEAVSHAREVLRVLAEAERDGHAAAQVHGRMVDVPMIERARRVLRRAGESEPPVGPCD